jgi:hypothetical protein
VADQVKWGESRIQHEGDGFVAHRITSGWSTSAEHHAALDVFGDVAVSHPGRGAVDIEQDVDDLTVC